MPRNPRARKPRKLGYARCSTSRKKQDVERQKRDLRARGAEKIFTEYGSGAIYAREELQKVLTQLEEGDTLAATEVSRLTRRLPHLLEIIELAAAKKIILSFGAIDFDFTQKISAMHLAMLQMMGIFAELERNLDCERINSGIENAKAKGIKLGRPKMTAADVPEHIKKTIKRDAEKLKSGETTKAKLAKKCGVSRPTLDKYMTLVCGDGIEVL